MLELKHVSVRFSAESSVQAVEDVSLALPDGEKMALVGETGSGKSVLLLAILRLLPETAVCSGEILLRGENLLQADRRRLCRVRGGEIAYIPQSGGNSLNPLLTVGFQVGEPRMEHFGETKKQAAAAAVALFRSLNLGREEQLARAYPHSFSGGMRQRALVAMGMAADAGIVLADEPTKGLDEKRVALVAEAFHRLGARTLLCVTHDLGFAGQIAQTVCVLYAGQQVELGPAAAVLGQPLHPYTQDLIAAMPEHGMECRSLRFAPPHVGAGCRYQTRCGRCTAACSEAPPLRAVGERMVRCWHAGA